MIYKSAQKSDIDLIRPCRWVVASRRGKTGLDLDFVDDRFIALSLFEAISREDDCDECALVGVRAAIYVVAGHVGVERLSSWVTSAAAAAGSRYWWPRTSAVNTGRTADLS